MSIVLPFGEFNPLEVSFYIRTSFRAPNICIRCQRQIINLAIYDIALLSDIILKSEQSSKVGDLKMRFSPTALPEKALLRISIPVLVAASFRLEQAKDD